MKMKNSTRRALIRKLALAGLSVCAAQVASAANVGPSRADPVRRVVGLNGRSRSKRTVNGCRFVGSELTVLKGAHRRIKLVEELA
jgi:hypothetical protein